MATQETKEEEIKEEDVKEEGKAGLHYAYDSKGNYVYAGEATPKEKHTCPFCRCRLHLTTNPYTKSKYFARDPGEIHTHPKCMDIESGGREYTFRALTPVGFIGKLCHVSSRQKVTPPKGPGITPPDEPPKVETPPNEYADKPFGSLKQIADSGIENLNPNDMQGNYKVSDFVITWKFAYIMSKSGFALGARIVYARYVSFDSKAKTLYFHLFFGAKDEQKTFVIFRLIFLKDKDFKKYRDKFGKFVINEKTGKTEFAVHHKKQDVLLASDDWKFLSKPSCENTCYRCAKNEEAMQCSASDHCLGTYTTVFTNPKQIYLMPADY